MAERRSKRWTPQEHDRFRTMAEANTRSDRGKTEPIGSRQQGTRLHDRTAVEMV
jgi:hypothetical protein